jgi:hypothetical protein
MRLQLNNFVVQLLVFRSASRSSGRGELRSPVGPQILLAAMLLAGTSAYADDRADTTVTWFQEKRADNNSLTVIHPQFDLAVDLGSHVNLNAGYEADIVSGATPSIYLAPKPGVDVISTASQFSDTRHQGKVGLTITGTRSSLSVGYSYGTERDYRSHTISAGGTVDLPGKNTTFALSYSRNIDSVCDLNNGDLAPLERRPLSGQNACFTDDPMANTLSLPVDINTVQGSITQNLSPTMVLQLGVYGQIIQGFQSNPYRRVRVYDVDAQESVPLTRDRGSGYIRLNIAVPVIHGAISLFLRGYSDSWGVDAGSVEAMYHQYLGKRVLFRLRGRAYQQTGAIFFRDAEDYQNVGPVGAYFTGDRELSPFRTVMAGGKLSYLVSSHDGHPIWGLFDDIDFHINAEAIWTMSLTPNPPGGDVSGALPDIIVAQLGLLLRY